MDGITVRAGSWHHRVHAWFRTTTGMDPDPPVQSLCTYFWTTFLLAPLLAATLAIGWVGSRIGRHAILPAGRGIARVSGWIGLGRAARAAGSWIARHEDGIGRFLAGVAIVVVVGLVAITLWQCFSDSWFWTTVALVCGPLGVVLLVIGISIVWDAISARREDRRYVRSLRAPRERGTPVATVAWRYVRARKARFCPPVRVV